MYDHNLPGGLRCALAVDAPSWPATGTLWLNRHHFEMTSARHRRHSPQEADERSTSVRTVSGGLPGLGKLEDLDATSVHTAAGAGAPS